MSQTDSATVLTLPLLHVWMKTGYQGNVLTSIVWPASHGTASSMITEGKTLEGHACVLRSRARKRGSTRRLKANDQIGQMNMDNNDSAKMFPAVRLLAAIARTMEISKTLHSNGQSP